MLKNILFKIKNIFLFVFGKLSLPVVDMLTKVNVLKDYFEIKENESLKSFFGSFTEDARINLLIDVLESNPFIYKYLVDTKNFWVSREWNIGDVLVPQENFDSDISEFSESVGVPEDPLIYLKLLGKVVLYAGICAFSIYGVYSFFPKPEVISVVSSEPNGISASIPHCDSFSVVDNVLKIWEYVGSWFF